MLFPWPEPRRGPVSLLRWWEARRLFYNEAVGAAGLVTCAGAFVLSPDRAELLAPPFALVVLAYGVLANVCYSFGFLVELMARWGWGDDAPHMGPLLFRHGLVFSIGVTLLPLAVLMLARVLQLLLRLVT